jgi:hypothetical protein
LLEIAQYARCARVKIAQALSLLGILEDPVDSRQVVVSYAPPRALDIPVQTSGVLGVLQVVVRISGGIEVVEDELCLVIGARAGAELLGA